MRVLFYNWVQYDDPERRGGGIRHYQQNLIDHLSRDTDHDVTVLSSGLEHDALNRQIRIEKTENSHPDRVRSFTLVNSLVPAPGHHAFGSPWLFDDDGMLTVWHQFLVEHGPFDVIQFDSLEGIPFTFLRVHEQLPDAKVVLYAHNYYMLCPQVNLWKRELTHCTDFRQGRDCVSCIPQPANSREVVRAHQLSRVLRTIGVVPGTRRYRYCYQLYGQLRRVRRLVGRIGKATRNLFKSSRATPARAASNGHVSSGKPGSPPTLLSLRDVSEAPTGRSTPPVFVERRTRGLELINQETDLVLATSLRVKEVLSDYGVSAEKIAVSYIGTRAAETAELDNRRKKLNEPSQLSIAYLGYARADKGFPFLLEALERCPDEIRSRLRLVVAALGADSMTLRRLETLADAMVDVEYCAGYSHDQLPKLLETADVGVVPVQWEDCLPQVAIEMVANGLPIITSHRGGAKELGGSNSSFVFTANSQSELIDIWRRLLESELLPGDFWDTAGDLVTMKNHLGRLMRLYRTGVADDRHLSHSATASGE
ncbi:MAG: glycosyltransferase [Actinophytocola sp.]|nr:glycosyltransferase [Actinophytocola sp.]